MKYLGNETKVEVKTKSVRKVEYIRCDGCGKKIMPDKYRTEENSYVRIHTWHNDWGNDSVDSHKYGDYCKECAKSFVSAYVDKIGGTEELELRHENLWSGETYEGYEKYDDGYDLVEDDKKMKQKTKMAHWIIDDHGFGGTFYKCSKCGNTYCDIFDDVGGEEECPNCKTPIDEDANVYMKNGKVEK